MFYNILSMSMMNIGNINAVLRFGCESRLVVDQKNFFEEI